MESCVLCTEAGGELLWKNEVCRVVLIADKHYVGYCRVISHKHVKEMSDLSASERMHLMGVVFAVEQVLRDLLRPTKINLASFGNVVPHLHWHVIPRFSYDPHFPEPVWGLVQREQHPPLPTLEPEVLRRALAHALHSFHLHPLHSGHVI